MRRIHSKIRKYIREHPELKKFIQKREFGLVIFFGFLFFVLIARLLYLQVFNKSYYESILFNQHIQKMKLKAKRGNIYVTDRANQKIKLTENIDLYNVFVDPEFVIDEKVWTYMSGKLKQFDITQREKFLQVMTPVVYTHLCKYYKFSEPSKKDCIQNVEKFTNKTILPEEPKIYYYISWVVSKNYYDFDRTWYNKSYNKSFQKFNTKVAMKLIRDQLDKMIVHWERKYNYLWFFDNNMFLQELNNRNFWYLSINNWYIYLEYDKIKKRKKQVIRDLKPILTKYWYQNSLKYLPKALEKKRYRYVKIIQDANPVIAKTIENLKQKYYKIVTADKNRIPVLYWVWLEQYKSRYYPYKNFLSNIIGYINKKWEAFHGIEEYFDEILKWVDWKIEWRSSSIIWNVGSNDFDIQNVKNWSDIYLTIDPWIQKRIEMIAKDYQEYLNSDSVSILIYDPYSWHIKASVSYPNYDPNNYEQSYFLQPLSPKYDYLLKDETMVDRPVYIEDTTWWNRRIATIDERINKITKKYIPKNIYWPTVFVDKNISYPYDPWSIFKTLTFGIWLDTNEITRYEFYDDPDNYVEIDMWGYKRKIKNANKICQWTHNFLFSLEHSCNVWILKIVQKITKRTFYNYIKKLWFGKETWIELAWEDWGYVPEPTTVSYTRFLNNSFGLWLLVTPLQMATAYGSLVNSWKLMKPTILSKICKEDWTCVKNKPIVAKQVFSPELSEKIKTSLVRVVQAEENAKHVAISWYDLWGKSWTSAIVFKWKYMDGNWRTNASYAWIITKDNLKYIVVVQVRRPRISQRWTETAGKVFKQVAKFLVWYELIDKIEFDKQK